MPAESGETWLIRWHPAQQQVLRLLLLLSVVPQAAAVGSRLGPGSQCVWCDDIPWNGTNLKGGEVDGREYDDCDVKYAGPGEKYGGRVGIASDCCGWCADLQGCDGWTWDSNNGGVCFFKRVEKCKAVESSKDEKGQQVYSATLKTNSQPGRCKYDPDDQPEPEPDPGPEPLEPVPTFSPGVGCKWCQDRNWNGTNLAGEVNGVRYPGCDVGDRREGDYSKCCGWCLQIDGCNGYTWDANDNEPIGYCNFKHVQKCHPVPSSRDEQKNGQRLYSATVSQKESDGFQPGKCEYSDQPEPEPDAPPPPAPEPEPAPPPPSPDPEPCPGCELPREEVEFLRDFYILTGGKHWLEPKTGGWKDAADAGWDPQKVKPCSDDGWTGVTCAGSHIITLLFSPGQPDISPCSGNNLTGWLPSSFARLPKLSSLQIGGPVPMCVGVKRADLFCDVVNQDKCVAGTGQLSGTLPDFAENRELSVFRVANTLVSGTLPSVLPPKLQNLMLPNNQLSGTFPYDDKSGKVLGKQCKGLIQLEFGANPVSGTLPRNSFPASTDLKFLDVYETSLSGTLPDLPDKLQNFHGQSSGFTHLPPNLGELSSLMEFSAAAQHVDHVDETRELPSALSKLSTLRSLQLASGGWVGHIPAGLGKLSSVIFLEFHDNELSGTISEDICELNAINKYTVSNNWLSGTIPSCFGNLATLTELWLNNNRLSGSLHEGLSQLTDLVLFPLSFNKIAGTIPSQFGSLSKLKKFSVNDNQLELDGTDMDRWLGSLTDVTDIQLSRNKKLTGLPSKSLATLPQLSRFEAADFAVVDTEMDLEVALPRLMLRIDLSSSGLAKAKLPESWNILSELQHLDLSDCGLTDDFNPHDVFLSMPNLRTLLLSNNSLTRVPESLWVIPGLQRLAIDNNQLSSNMYSILYGIAPGRERPGHPANVSLEILELGSNQISGTIPLGAFSEAWGLMRLTDLDLSNNSIIGTFPGIFDTLPLRTINVANNSLAGFLPPSLVELPHLRLFDATGNPQMKECTGSDWCADRQFLVEKNPSEVVENLESNCYQIRPTEPSMQLATFRMDSSYPKINHCVCNNGYIGSRSQCIPCRPRFEEDKYDVVSCLSEKGEDASLVRDGYFPVLPSHMKNFTQTWSCSGCRNSTIQAVSDAGSFEVPVAVVKCPVAARFHNPCTNEASKNGFSPLKEWRCLEGYKGAACLQCDKPRYARELGSRICVKCDFGADLMPFVYLFIVIVMVVWLVKKDMNSSNLGSSFVFYFQAMTLIKRSVLPWNDTSKLWTALTAALNMNPALTGCVAYLEWLNEPEARFWFTVAIPVYIVCICAVVYAFCEGWDRCRHDRATRNERMTQGGMHYDVHSIQQVDPQPLLADSSSNLEADNVLNSMKPIHRAYKLCFALLNMCYLPLSFQAFSGLRAASEEFDFSGFEGGAVWTGRYLLNAPTISATSAAATRMNIASWVFLIVYVILIPLAMYLYIYRPLVYQHTDNSTGWMNKQAPLVLICGSYFGAYRSSNAEIQETGIINEPAETEEMARTRTTRGDINSRGCACFKHQPGEYRWWPLFVVLPRRVLFTMVVAFFPPNSPLLPLFIFMLLLAALLLQFRYQPLCNKLDNLLEGFTLAALLMCFMLAQTELASGDEVTKSTQREIATFVDFAKYFDLLVIIIFSFCVMGRKLVENDWSWLGCEWVWLQRLIGERVSVLLRPLRNTRMNTASQKNLEPLANGADEIGGAE